LRYHGTITQGAHEKPRLVPRPATLALSVEIAGRARGGVLVETPRRHRVVEGGRVAERVRVRDISNDEGNRLLRIVRRSSGSVVTWRRAQMVLLSAQAMEVPEIARVTFTSEDRVRDVLHNLQPGRVSTPSTRAMPVGAHPPSP
jgi:hypothetical protein